jgi:protein-tyrosine-phosphatase
MSDQPLRLLFLCTGNSCRSQMAESLARALGGGKVEVHSAGAAPEPVHPLAVKSMAEVDIDISRQKSKSLAGFLAQRFDFVITLCDRMTEACPTLPTAREDIHWRIEDAAAAAGPSSVRAPSVCPSARRRSSRERSWEPEPASA